MVSLRRAARISLAVLALFGGIAIAAPSHVGATTGPSHFLPPSKFKVGNKLAQQYAGQYILKSVASAARLSGGSMGIEIDDAGFLYGIGQFYGYDASGHQSTWTATLYNFHQDSHQVMTFDLTGPAGRPLLGRLVVSRSKAGDLSGQIVLPTGRFAISWHKLSS